MGMLSSSATFVRFSVEGDLPANFWSFAAERIAQNSFQDIDDTFDEYSIGWVSVLNMFDAEFEYASYAASDYVVLSLRIDERKISSTVLKKYCLKEEDRVKKERQIPKVSRGHRLEIKENMRLMLIKKAVPVPVVYDLIWNLAESTLLFFSTSGKAQEALEEAFKTTFDLHLVRQIPYTAALHLLDPAEEDLLANVTPSVFL